MFTQNKLVRKVYAYLSLFALSLQIFQPTFLALTLAPTLVPTTINAEESAPAPTPDPTIAPTPDPTPSPDPTPTPELSPSPEPTIAPSPAAALAPSPEPTNTPVTPAPSAESLPAPPDLLEPEPQVAEESAETVETIEPSVVETTKSSPDQEIVDSANLDWNINETEGSAATKESVGLGVKYIFPLETGVTVTFTSLPSDQSLRAPLKIEKVKVSDLNLDDEVKPYGEYAYDVTTNMVDETFEYDITLPKADDQVAEVLYMEDANSTPILIDNSKTTQDDGVVKANDLNHFTIFIVTNSGNGPVLTTALVNNQTQVTVSPNESITATIRVTTSGFGNSDDWRSSEYRIEGGDWECVDTADYSSDITNQSASFSFNAPSSVGTYDIEFRAYNLANCNDAGSGNPSSTVELQNAILVQHSVVTNPNLNATCGIDVGLIVDTSTSIDNSELGQMKTALKTFVNAFIGTPTQMAIVSFDDHADLESGFTSNLSSLTTSGGVIDDIDGSGYTNWEDALYDTRLLFPNRADKPDLIVFTSDGNPTASSAGPNNTSQPNAHLSPAITQANLAKAAGIRIITLGIGNDLSAANLQAISSADAYYSAANFDTLTTTLQELATDLCGSTVSVTKLIDADGKANTTNDRTPASGWTFNIGGQTGQMTDANGQTNAVTLSPNTGYSVTETVQSGYSLLSASCTGATNNGVSNGTNAVTGIQVGSNDIISCTFINSPIQKIDICHATASHQNPYIINSPDRSGDVNGHDGHNGVVWYPGIADHSWGDIIPPFDYVGGSYPGKNWTAEGQAIYNNGCNIPSGTLTVTKTLIPANDPGLFNLTINGTAYVNNIGNGGTTGPQIVTAGSYTVGETAGTNTSLADYLTTYGGDCSAQGQVTVGVGETKSCTITNTRRVGEITLLKQVLGGSAVPTDWEFEVLGVGTFQNGTFIFNTGSYSVTEMTDVLGYSMTGVSGSCSSPNLDAGSATLTVTEQGGTCTFTNTRDTGSVKVNKLVDTNGDNQYEGGNTEANNLGFTWSLDGVGANAMGATVSNVPTTIPQVSHLVNESLSTAYAFVGWYITSDTSRSCLNPTGTTLPITVQVVKGQTAEITLCNQRSTGTITIIKDSQPNNAQNFSFTTTGGNGLPGSFLLDDDNNAALPRSRTYNLPTGQYAFTEGTVGGWQVTDIQCSDENSLVNLDTRRATVNLDANEQVTCIFTNTQLGRIAGLKFNDKNGNGQLNLLEGEHGLANWQIFIDQNNNSLYDPTEQSATTSSFFLTYGAYSFNNLLPGDYTVCETMQAGWYNSTPLCQNVTLGAGDAETVSFGNHQDLTIRAYKIVCDLESDLPNWGHGAPNITASTASSYVANNPGCRLAADWEFEYGYDRQVSKYGNGDQLGTAGDPWMSMGTTNADGYTEITLTDLQGADGVWVREALKENYVPFSYPEAGPTEDNYSAELYCHQDGQHYDNYDQVDNIQFGKNYYCVAFNALNTGDLEVIKYHDLNGDGNQDDSEPTLQGWEINLEGQSSENTDSEGKAHFSDLVVGNYSLSETLQEGWVQTKISCDQEEAEREPEMQALVQLETDDLEKNPFHPVTINPGQTTHCLIGNQQTPVLTLTKANDAVGSLGTGSQVLYTLTVNLTGSNLTNVILTDLPPTDFSYQSGSWTAASDVRGDLKLAVTTPEPTYASPGTWQLGDMTVGETVTLSYIAKIGPDVEPGTYRDLAWVAGSSAGWGKTLANQSSNPTTFVGTEVTVDRSLAEGRGVDVIQEGEVLGASTYLPATGSDTRYLILALGLLFAGLCLFFGSAILSRGLLVMALLLIPAFSAPPTYAADDPSLSIRLESPKTPTRLQNQKLAYSVLSTDSDTDLTIRCYAKRPGEVSFSQFGPTQTLAASGNSGNCELTASLVSARGTYEFYVTATDSSAIVEESSTVTMFYENEGPGTPHSYSKDHPSICRYVLKFKTADDSGRTTSVEIYRSQELSFTAGPGTFVGGLSATSNTEYSYVHDFGSDCDKTWYYAVRAFDSAGNGSGVVGDTITTTASSTSLISTPSALTLQTLPSGVILGDKTADSSGSGEVEGAETTIIESSGLVDDLTQVFANRPWWHYALTGASLILLLFLLYRRFKRQ